MDNELVKILEQERQQLLLKLNMVEQTIFAYKHADIVTVEIPDNFLPEDQLLIYRSKQSLLQKYHDYSRQHPIRIKIINILRTENRFLHVREIARIAQQLENVSSASLMIKKISPALSVLKKIPGSPVISVEVARSHFNTFWGCKDWLTENGEIKQPFMYNENEIKNFTTRSFPVSAISSQGYTLSL